MNARSFGAKLPMSSGRMDELHRFRRGRGPSMVYRGLPLSFLVLYAFEKKAIWLSTERCTHSIPPVWWTFPSRTNSFLKLTTFCQGTIRPAKECRCPSLGEWKFIKLLYPY